MSTITAYLTKNEVGKNVELWRTKPYYDKEIDEWLSRVPSEVGSEIFDDLLTDFVNEKECVKITITTEKKMDEKDHDRIPIVSVGKDITLEEFRQQYYQPGKVYRINNGLLHKCTGYTPGGRPIIDTICFLLQPSPYTGYQIIKDINAEGSVIPGLDFVNERMSGKIQEIDPNIWDRVDNMCCSLCKDLEEIIKK